MTNPNFLDMTSSATTLIPHAIDVVWPYVLNQSAWMTEFNVTTINGVTNREGEIKKVSHLEQGFEDFFFKTLTVVPYRKLVYKAYTANRAGDYGFTGIEILSLGDLGNQSTLCFEAYLEVVSIGMSQEELTKFVAESREGSIAMWQRNFQRLITLINSGQQ